jgi:MFS family permease
VGSGSQVVHKRGEPTQHLVVVADLMRGTGRFNVALGAVMTAQGVGAALSTTLAGLVVVRAGYGAAFLTLAAVAALLLVFLAMPESRGHEPSGHPSDSADAADGVGAVLRRRALAAE